MHCCARRMGLSACSIPRLRNGGTGFIWYHLARGSLILAVSSPNQELCDNVDGGRATRTTIMAIPGSRYRYNRDPPGMTNIGICPLHSRRHAGGERHFDDALRTMQWFQNLLRGPRLAVSL